MYLTFLAASDVKLGDAALYSLIGFLIVFAVLAFYLMGAIFRSKLFNMPKKEKKKGKSATETVAAPSASDDDEDEVVAAITAAISVMLEQESGEPAEFVIRRITRKK